MLCRLCVIASFDGSPWVLPHAHAWVLLPLYTVCCAPYFILICYALRILPHGWVLLLLYTLCYALRILLHAWVPPSLYTIYTMHCGYHHMLGYCHCFILYNIMLCTADTTTSLDIAIALYYMLCTTDTAICVGTAIALYYMLCTAGTLTCVGTTIILY